MALKFMNSIEHIKKKTLKDITNFMKNNNRLSRTQDKPSPVPSVAEDKVSVEPEQFMSSELFQKNIYL